MDVLVVAAVILKDNKVLLAQRRHNKFDKMWEFPGGKKEPGESDVECLVREIKEELNVNIRVNELFTTARHSYDDFDVSIKFYFTTILEANFKLSVHYRVAFVSPKNIGKYRLLPSNVGVAKKLEKYLSNC